MQSALLYEETRPTLQGFPVTKSTFVWTGLTPNSPNTLPFPNNDKPLRPPRCVTLQSLGNGAVGVVVTLDTSQGTSDPTGLLAGGKLGWDQNNLYVQIGNGTQVEATVEW